MDKELSLLIVGGMGDRRFMAKTSPLITNTRIKKTYLFRYKGNVYQDNERVKTLPFCNKGARPLGLLPRRIFDIYNLIGFSFLLLFKRIDIIVGIYLYPHGYFASLLGKIFNKPVVLVLPGSDLKMYKQRKNSTDKKLFKNARYFGMRGNESINDLINDGFERDRLFALHNVFLLPEFDASKFITRPYDMIFTGFIRKGKRVDILLNALKKIKEEVPDISCLIVGDGEDKENMIKLSKELGLEKNVIFKSYVHEIRKVLILAKIYIMTSESEGLPMSMIEAMSYGLPPVVSNINDIPDVVKHGENGLLVDVLDIDNFAKYSILLLKDDKLRQKMGLNARKTIEHLYEKEYSYDAVYRTWDTILNKIS